MRNIILLLLVIVLSCKNEKKIILLEEVYGTYEHIYYDEDPKWHKVKNTITINRDSTYNHQLYIGGELFIDEVGRYEYNKFVPCINLKNYTKYIKWTSTTPENKPNIMFIVKNNLWGKIILVYNLPMDPDGAPTSPRYKKIK